MKLRNSSLFKGICLAVSAVIAIPIYATSSTAFSSFHVEGPLSSSQNPYTCLNEDNGAVVNNCTYSVSLEFNLPITNTGSHPITVQPYWKWKAGTSFSCTAYAYAGYQSSSTNQSPNFVFGAPPVNILAPPQTESVNVANNGESIQLICWSVPPGDGVANINWTF